MRFSGGELNPEEMYLPDNMFARVLRISCTAPMSIPKLIIDAAKVRILGLYMDDIVVDGIRGGVTLTMRETMGMAKRQTRSTRDTKPDDLEAVTPKDNEPRSAPAPSARASAPPKQPTAIVREHPDRTPKVTMNHFVRGTTDPILRAFAHHERLTAGTRKLTRAQWQDEYEAFRGASR